MIDPALLARGTSDEPFPLSGLDALLATAARTSRDTILMADDTGASTADELARRARRLAERLRLSGLQPGERVLIVAGAEVAAFVAIVAAVRAGLEPALVRCGLGPVELSAHARAAQAVAILGPSHYGEALGETYLSAAAVAEGVRLVATQGPERVDGALDVSFAALDASPEPEAPGEPPLEMPVIATFSGPASAPVMISHRQAALFADALSLVEQAHINPTRRILSLLPPSSRAGLVAGPFAALIGASGLALHGPFEARRFLAHCDAEPGSHLVAPEVIGAVLADEIAVGTLSSLILVSRFPEAEAFALPEPLPAGQPVVDLYAFGEDLVISQRRLDGEARPPHRVTDRSLADGLGARLNRARAEHRLHETEGR